MTINRDSGQTHKGRTVYTIPRSIQSKDASDIIFSTHDIPQPRGVFIHKNAPLGPNGSATVPVFSVMACCELYGGRKDWKLPGPSVDLVNASWMAQSAELRGLWNLQKTTILSDVVLPWEAAQPAAMALNAHGFPSGTAFLIALNNAVQSVLSYPPGVALLFLFFAGHGVSIPDEDGDEVDGYDEALFMSDHVAITDDALRGTLSRLRSEDRCLAIMDCCHSASILDLKHTLKAGDDKPTQEKTDINANVLCVSGCSDSDQSFNGKFRNLVSGALTTSILELAGYGRNQEPTGDPEKDQVKGIKSNKEIGSSGVSFLNTLQSKIKTLGSTQVPHLSCSNKFLKSMMSQPTEMWGL